MFSGIFHPWKMQGRISGALRQCSTDFFTGFLQGRFSSIRPVLLHYFIFYIVHDFVLQGRNTHISFVWSFCVQQNVAIFGGELPAGGEKEPYLKQTMC